MAPKLRSLQDLSIRNIGVIDQAQISLGPGFNVITGETGAGKTMILTGLGLLAGIRSDTDLIRHGADRLSVTLAATLEPEPSGFIQHLIETHSPEIENGVLLLQRSVSRDGKSKAIVGSDQTTLSVLSQFTAEFLAIHGQGSNQRITDNDYQLQLLDRTDDQIGQLLSRYQSDRRAYKEKDRELSDLLRALDDKEREISSLTKFLAEYDRIRLTPGEWDELEDRIHRLDSIEDLRLSLSGALSALDGDGEGNGALGFISEALRSLNLFRSPDLRGKELLSRLRAAQLEIGEVAAVLSSDLASLDVDPGALDALRERRAALRQFSQRQREFLQGDLSESAALDRLIEEAPEKRRLLATLLGDDDLVGVLRGELSTLEDQMHRSARELSERRKEAADRLASRVNDELHQLGLDQAVFQIAFIGDGGLSETGCDALEFLFSAHESGKPLPLHKGASGGELSRVMLAIELALAEHREIGALIFDEIDSGIGGETGLIIGERISRLAEHFQVIVITHLAQVAVWADRHYRIEKINEESSFVSTVEEISGDERVIEIARMLSGQSDSDAAQKHARELLKHAGK